MSATRSTKNWTAMLAWGLLLLIAGAAIAAWGLARWDGAARALGVAPKNELAFQPQRVALPPDVLGAGADPTTPQRLQAIESRLSAVEATSRQAAGSVGRADALLVAFAARRALDRGAPLGYLEALLDDRFGAAHQRAVATIVGSARQPVTLDQLRNDYLALKGELGRGGPEESLWQALRREAGSMIEIRRASTPSPRPEARYDRARAYLEAGQVDEALAETMRMPGAARAGGWVTAARRYVLAHRALDEIESSALLAGSR